MRIDLYTLPDEVPAGGLRNRCVVVIDVLRASTTVVTAIANGCREIIPAETVEEAVATRRRIAPGDALLCGERGGRKIPGFDLGNSPREYRPEAVAGKTLVFTSTNGARAMAKAGECHLGLVGAFVNAGAVGRRIRSEGRDVTIICSGREGVLSIEDVTCGGLIVARALEWSVGAVLNDAARVAAVACEHYRGDIPGLLRSSDHGRYLAGIGFGEDLAICGQVDAFDTLPLMREGVIVAQ